MQDISLAGTALGANRDLVVVLYPTPGTSRNGLIGIVRRVGNHRLARRALGQLNGIFELRRLIARQRLAIEIDHLERGIGGLLDGEIDGINRGVAVARHDGDTRLAIDPAGQYGDGLKLVAFDGLDSRQLGRADR